MIISCIWAQKNNGRLISVDFLTEYHYFVLMNLIKMFMIDLLEAHKNLSHVGLSIPTRNPYFSWGFAFIW